MQMGLLLPNTRFVLYNYASSTDIDGDTITYNFEWTGPNGQTSNHANQPGPVDTLPSNTPTTEGLWICSAEASDGVGVSLVDHWDYLCRKWVPA